ncbi:MAG TPA: C4-dicarboxylate ABC transporter, partial [Afifellaceae bacterium]|nr:C4-dicarboxylate ABC transporter [Afifellaceae bacterium]
ANTESWNKVPPHLQQLFRSTIDQSHYYRLGWYWGGEAKLRVEGDKLELTSIPESEWNQVVTAAETFWEEIAAESDRSKRVVEILRKYSSVMQKAGPPYRYG